MALAFRSANFANTGGVSSTNSVGPPAGTADDDILIYSLARAIVSGAITWPTGFTEISDTTHDGGSTACAWKRASSESGSYQSSWTGVTRVCGVIFAISGANTTGTPFTAGTAATGTGTTPDAPNVDPGSSDDRLAMAICGQEGKGTTRFTAPSGYTLPTSGEGGTTGLGSEDDYCGIGCFYKTYTGQSENPGTATSSVTDGWAAQTLIFDPQPTAAITGTATATIDEADVVAGGKTIVTTLTSDTWVAV